MSKVFVDSMELIIQWVVDGGDSDHCLIILDFLGGGRKPPNPFKFNPKWLEDVSLCELVKSEWEPFVMERDRYAGHILWII